ncbi:carboxy terminal-processing peptidase [Fulvivirgaceae bacterium BMA10]|uniref:Carboxy terminal-processing peptidase n=1 Tax=Splendidivirga corallicola TaxID=3051826 RepID=A0ABT8KZ37_9BACT|nr:carboxy terminal-processing peptidase [Fulvivirgaceae bacterium BMA10]
MKNRLYVFTPLFLIFFLFSSYEPTREVADKNEVLVRLIMQSLDQGHFQNKSVDDQFSNSVFNDYVEQIDFNKKFLTQEDMNVLGAFRDQIDDQVNKGSLEFFYRSEEIVTKRISEIAEFYKEILSKPFDFTKKENIEFDVEKIEFPANSKELKETWRKYLKYRTLVRLADAIKIQETRKEKGEKIEVKSFKALEEKARKDVLESHDEWFNRMFKLEQDDWLSIYLNTITATYDPHTNYLPPRDKENFDIAMAGQLEGIGARLMDKDGYVTVSEIVPGSACWKQGDLSVGDKILKVGQGDEEPLDIVNMRTDYAVKFIRGKKGTEVRLTVQKLDGSNMVIPIIRDVVVIKETYAKSAIIDGTGYIKLPKFYANFQDLEGRRCAVDVQKEIERLKEENVNGLVLDLRDNGGGSLQDVVEMAGLFIEKGPIVQVKGKRGEPRVFEDRDPDVLYDGPLVIMVNSYSASASEILAAAMQDYDRAVILGSSPATFGKGTVQRPFNLDGFISEDYADIKPLGAIKLTLQKFYRINGGATQLKGVKPDIILPDTRSYLDIGEKEQDHPIPWDEIEPLKFRKWEKSIPDIDNLREKSIVRTTDNETFELIDESARIYKERQKDTRFSLNLKEYQDKAAGIEKVASKYRNILKEVPGIKISRTVFDQNLIDGDSLALKDANRWYASIRKDVYVHEAVNIVNDMK